MVVDTLTAKVVLCFLYQEIISVVTSPVWLEILPSLKKIYIVVRNVFEKVMLFFILEKIHLNVVQLSHI